MKQVSVVKRNEQRNEAMPHYNNSKIYTVDYNQGDTLFRYYIASINEVNRSTLRKIPESIKQTYLSHGITIDMLQQGAIINERFDCSNNVPITSRQHLNRILYETINYDLEMHRISNQHLSNQQFVVINKMDSPPPPTNTKQAYFRAYYQTHKDKYVESQFKRNQIKKAKENYSKVLKSLNELYSFQKFNKYLIILE